MAGPRHCSSIDHCRQDLHVAQSDRLACHRVHEKAHGMIQQLLYVTDLLPALFGCCIAPLMGPALASLYVSAPVYCTAFLPHFTLLMSLLVSGQCLLALIGDRACDYTSKALCNLSSMCRDECPIALNTACEQVCKVCVMLAGHPQIL